jgi:hypothetical protein
MKFMDIYSKIKRSIQTISAEGRRQAYIYPAQVEAVSGRTCSVRIDDNLPVTDVRLRAVINTNAEQVLLTPKVGSYVLVADLSGGNHRDLAVIADRRQQYGLRRREPYLLRHAATPPRRRPAARLTGTAQAAPVYQPAQRPIPPILRRPPRSMPKRAIRAPAACRPRGWP